MRYKIPAFLCLLYIFLTAGEAKASHAAGGEIIYEWLSGSTYRIYFKFYRDCGGVPEQDSVEMCAVNACNMIIANHWLKKVTVLPGNIPNGSEVAIGCANYPTTCKDKLNGLPGYREWWYTKTITLPFKCDYWKFSVTISARNSSVNFYNPAGSYLYIESTLDNANAEGNSSPFFTVKPVPYVCLGQPYSFNNGMVDIDGDSLSFEMAQPQACVSTCGATPTPIQFASETPALNIIDNPFQTNNTFTISQTTGQMNFVPGRLGPQTVTMRVKEYRNKKLIGTVMRDIQVQVLTCANQPVINYGLNSFTNDSLVNGQVEACVGVPMSFCFNFKSSDDSTVLVASDNHVAAVPGSNVSYTGIKSSNLSGCLSWIPQLKDVGLKIFTVTVKDSTCRPPGISVSQTYDLSISVKSVNNDIDDTTICPDDSVQLNAINGTAFVWSTVPGGSNSTTISCINCKSTFVRPYVNTTYIVTTNQYAYCKRNIDTATVSLLARPEGTKASNNSPLCEYDTLRLFADSRPDSRYEWKGPRGYFSTELNPVNDSIVEEDTGYYYIKVFSLTTGCGSKLDSTFVTIKPAPDPHFELKDNTCVGMATEIKPYWDIYKVASYAWDFDGIDEIDTTIYNTYFLKWLNPGIKQVTVTETGFNGCISLPYVHKINVHALPAANIIDLNRNTVCAGDTLLLEADEMLNTTYTWLPEKYFKNAEQRIVTATIPKTGPVTLKLKDEWGCISSDSVLIQTEACCNVYLPDAFTPNDDGKNDKYRLITNGHHEVSVFTIVNRWGQVVFSTNDERQGWNGKLNGKDQELGVYYYYLKYKCVNEEYFEKSGSFILLR